MRPQLTVAFPCFNEESNILRVLAEWDRGLEREVKSYELLVIDNLSEDKTCRLVEQARKSNRRIRLIRNPTNLGYSGSCLQASHHARGRWVIFVDGDGQYRGVDGLKMWRVLRMDKFGLVIGHRVRRADPTVRKMTAFFFWVLFRLLVGVPAHDPNVGLRGWKNGDRWLFKYLQPGMPFANVQLICALRDHGAALGQISITHQSRGGGRSFYQFHKLPVVLFEFLKFIITRKNAVGRPYGAPVRLGVSKKGFSTRCWPDADTFLEA